ncbi:MULTISPECIES: alanine/glycine:cation symporter family protein [Bacillus]|uniref:alanine/glycine:cation symporter family protein n=1 Tax=Bacillus TaxID=1386 RepID=UPI0009944CF5|nr:alanine/glycine:cation symporter family protein [Bacillus cereus]MBJ7986781.1 alanine:cation symporter family protein [Bacillus cereus]OOQ95845.1 sodium:alanine symporter family protein [Bacillus cereus]
MVDIFSRFLEVTNNILWSYILIAMLIGFGLYFSFKLKFVQITHFGEMVSLISKGFNRKEKKKDSVSPFQAFCLSAAARIGIGNLAGVALAISMGGPGAIFWMWFIAILGAATSFVECTLAQIYKVKDGSRFRGGPAYYMEKGLNKRWMGIWFSLLITVAYGLIFNSVQANTVTIAFENAFGLERTIVGAVLALLVAVIIFGGIKSISRITEMIVPPMAIVYIGVAIFVVIKNFNMLPSIFLEIFNGAFGLDQAIAGGIGAAIKFGIQRGLFATEAGMGSSPNAAATSDVSHPVKQGLVQALGVFVDTFLVCTSTAFIVLCSGLYKGSNLEGIELTQQALSSQIGPWASTFLAIIIFLFAFSSLLGNYYYGETNIAFIKESKTWLLIYRVAVVGMVFFGSIAALQTVWSLADFFMGLMVFTNLIAISFLSKFAYAALVDYIKQKKQGKDPVFLASSIPGLKNTECWDGQDVEEKKQAI